MCGRYTLSTADGGRLADRFDTRDFPAPASALLQRYGRDDLEEVFLDIARGRQGARGAEEAVPA